MPAKHSPRKPRLSVAQLAIVGQFSDVAFDYPRLSFEQAAKKFLGAPFPSTPAGREFKREAKRIFDQERQK
jgi:hypothetical protein